MGPLEDQRDEGEDSTLAAVVRAHHEHDVLDGDDADERPQNQGEYAVDVRFRRGQAVFGLEALAEGVKRARSDVAVDDAERQESQFCETAAARVSFDGSTDLRDLLRLLQARRRSGGSKPRNLRK